MTWTQVDAEDAIRWIANQLVPAGSPDDPDWRGNRIDCCLPPGYGTYLKVFHEILEDLSVPDTDVTWDENARSGPPPPTNDPVAQLLHSTTLARGTPESEFPSRRILWRDLALGLGLTFHAEVNDRTFSRRFRGGSWPRYLVGPEEGTLTEVELAALLEALSPAPQRESVFLYWDLPMIVQGKDPHCVAGEVRHLSLNAWPKDTSCTPSYIWPDDRRWVIHTDYDLCFTLVACDAETAVRVLGCRQLETLEVPFESRIDSNSDSTNH